MDPIEPLECCENEKEPIKTTLCELVRAPERFHRKGVELRTAVYPFGIDTPTVLFDDSCSAYVRLDVRSDQSLQSDKAYQLLDRQIHMHHIVEATVSGRFELVLIPPGKHSHIRFRRCIGCCAPHSNPKIESRADSR
jgi:hypothetical protein